MYILYIYRHMLCLVVIIISGTAFGLTLLPHIRLRLPTSVDLTPNFFILLIKKKIIKNLSFKYLGLFPIAI